MVLLDDNMAEKLNLWIEKYRPRTVDGIILSQETKLILEKFKANKEIPHLLFIGIPGTGKTSLAKIIVTDILECDYLYINASDENGIDTIRNKVTKFAQTKSLNPGFKVIIMDESDALSQDAQRALRNILEEYIGTTRFIFTGNYEHKVIEAIRSRCQTLSFDNSPQDMAKHCFSILKQEDVVIPEEQKKLLVALIKKNYPDFRKTLNQLQKYSMSGTLSITDSETSEEFLDEVFDVLKKQDIVEVRKLLIANERVFQNDYHALMRNFLNHLYVLPVDIAKKRESMLVIAEHMYRHSFCIDTEINCFACFITLQKIFTSPRIETRKCSRTTPRSWP